MRGRGWLHNGVVGVNNEKLTGRANTFWPLWIDLDSSQANPPRPIVHLQTFLKNRPLAITNRSARRELFLPRVS
jgi:hypothetical protein